MSRGDPEIRVRVPLPIKAWVQRRAERNLRTQHSEVVAVLKETMDRENATTTNE